MLKAVIFDVDGMTIKMDKYFSQLFSEKYGLPLGDILKFFNNEFQQCLIGKADLKKEIKGIKPQGKPWTLNPLYPPLQGGQY